jgi:hypothetical protein
MRITTRRTLAAIVAAASLAMPASAIAQPVDLRGEAARQVQQSPYDSPTDDVGTIAAQAQERYYSSYGEPAPTTVAKPPEPSDHSQPQLVALLIAAMAVIGVTGATLGRRVRIRRRAARVIA